jgi:hypothetical protein
LLRSIHVSTFLLRPTRTWYFGFLILTHKNRLVFLLQNTRQAKKKKYFNQYIGNRRLGLYGVIILRALYYLFRGTILDTLGHRIRRNRQKTPLNNI